VEVDKSFSFRNPQGGGFLEMGYRCKNLVEKGTERSLKCIGDLWIFGDLGTEGLRTIAHGSLPRRFSRGEAIFWQGDPADEVFLVKAGRIKLNKVLEDGTEITLDIRKAWDFIGENMLCEEASYPVTAWSTEETLTCGFRRDQFERLVLEHPDIGLQVIKNMSKRISWLTRRIESMAASNLEDRLYGVLANVAHEHGISCPRGLIVQLPLTHEDLSFLVGAHRVSTTRAMKALAQSGKIIREGKTLILPLKVS
jgi:CRP/FNR family transcriptional regulator